MVHKPDNGNRSLGDKLTHRIQRMESADIPNRDVDYELVREENPLESVRIPNRLVGVSASGDFMTEFSKRFEEMVVNSQENKIEVEKIKVALLNLDKRINGSMGEIEKHICEGVAWHRVIVGVIVSIAIQAMAFAYMFGTISEKLSTEIFNGNRREGVQTQLRESIIGLSKDFYLHDKVAVDLHKKGGSK